MGDTYNCLEITIAVGSTTATSTTIAVAFANIVLRLLGDFRLNF